MKVAIERRLAGVEADVEAVVRRLLPAPSDPDDPMTLLRYLTCEELLRFEHVVRGAADGEIDEDEACAAWDDAKRRALSRMLVGADIRVLDEKEGASRVLVRIPMDEPAIPGRTHLVAYLADQSHPDLWHVEAVYHGALPRVMTTAELARRDPTPWPSRALR